MLAGPRMLGLALVASLLAVGCSGGDVEPVPCGSETCGAGEICVQPCCGGALPPCEPLPDGGTCSGEGDPCTVPGGGDGCRYLCDPPPPRCEPRPGDCSDGSDCCSDGTGCCGTYRADDRTLQCLCA